MADKKILTGLDRGLFEDLYRYLASRPWSEVNEMIQGLMNAPKIEVTPDPVIKKEDKKKPEEGHG